MFNLGTKQIVLNGSGSITEVPATAEAPGVITIEGFGVFTIPSVAAAAARVGAITESSNAVAGVYTITPVTPYDPTKTYVLVLGIRSSRVLSNIFSNRDALTFQSKMGSANIGSAFAAGQIAGFNDQMVKFSGTTTLIATMQKGYEGVAIESISIRESLTEAPQAYTWAITTQPSEGVNLGRHIEEEVQNSTFENLDPYGAKGGSDTVDVRGKYTEITWTCVAEDDDSPGWAPHEMLGYGDANTETRYAPRSYCAYVNEGSASATVEMLRKLVEGEDFV